MDQVQPSQGVVLVLALVPGHWLAREDYFCQALPLDDASQAPEVVRQEAVQEVQLLPYPHMAVKALLLLVAAAAELLLPQQ